MPKSTLDCPEPVPASTRSCPFCGEMPHCCHWHGGARTKRLVYCDNEQCAVAPQVTGETKREALDRWNCRSN